MDSEPGQPRSREPNVHKRYALVTGAASGIGRAIAERFVKEGLTVWMLDADSSIDQCAAALGGDTLGFQLDVRDAAAWAGLRSEWSRRRSGAPDVLVNNAGVGTAGTLAETGPEELDRLYAVNVRGVYLGCRAFVPQMIESGRGCVINVASVGGLVAIPDRVAYCTTKFAVVGLTRCLARDHADSGVRFNGLCPGRVDTDWVRQRIVESEDPAATEQAMVESQPNGRLVKPEEVANAAAYLASAGAGAVNGAMMTIDGGWLA